MIPRMTFIGLLRKLVVTNDTKLGHLLGLGLYRFLSEKKSITLDSLKGLAECLA
jgi:hypothetical protein